MEFRRAIVVSTALVCAVADLVQKTFTQAAFHHARAPYVTLIVGALIVSLVVLVPRVPSTAAALGAGAACGGALGNLVSLLTWSRGVPDPFVVGTNSGVAFNLADVFAVCGDAVLLSAIVLYGVQQRARLRERI